MLTALMLGLTRAMRTVRTINLDQKASGGTSHSSLYLLATVRPGPYLWTLGKVCPFGCGSEPGLQLDVGGPREAQGRLKLPGRLGAGAGPAKHAGGGPDWEAKGVEQSER